LRDLFAAYDDLSAEQPVPRATAKHDLWTAPERSAGKAKSRTKLV
jgi:hypothetical protein